MLLSKIAWTLVLGAVLLVPLWSIEGKIHERQGRAIGVADELAASGVGEQAVSGPVFVRPCSERFRAEREDDEGKTPIVTLVRDCSARYVPRTLGIDGTLATEVRERGIYRTLFYGAGLVLDGSVDLPPLAGPAADVIDRAVGDLELRMGISDVRGIDAGSNLQWGAQAVAFAPGSRDASLGRGVHARLPGVAPGNHRFRVRLQLRGTRSLQFVPLARDTRIALRGSWPHPSFHGRFLPQARTVQPVSPDSAWNVWFATNPRTRKVRDVEQQSRVALHYFDTVTESYVAITGRARVVRDRASKDAHWNPAWTPYYKNRDTDVVLIVVQAAKVEVVSPRMGVDNDKDTWLPQSFAPRSSPTARRPSR